jgi:NUMOD4 motif
MTAELLDHLERIIYDERWLPIPDWEGLYSISNHHRVRTEPHKAKRANGSWFTTQGCIRQLDERRGGALMCKLRRPGYEQTIHVGRLVAELFAGDQK